MTRWDKEVELFVKLGYYGLTTGRGKQRFSPYPQTGNSTTDNAAIQTLGEEYTDTWQHSSFDQRLPSHRARAALILLPTLPSYILARWGSGLTRLNPRISVLLKALPTAFEVASEINLAVFYLRGTYYDLVKRLLGIQHVRQTLNLFALRFIEPLLDIIASAGPTYSTTIVFPAWNTPRGSAPSPANILY